MSYRGSTERFGGDVHFTGDVTITNPLSVRVLESGLTWGTLTKSPYFVDGSDSTNYFTSVGGGQTAGYSGGGAPIEFPCMIGVATTSGVDIAVSTDEGGSWHAIYSDGTGSYATAHSDIDSYGPNLVVGIADGIIGISPLSTLTSDPPGAITSTRHNPSDLVSSSGNCVRAAIDGVGGYIWAAGKPSATDDLRVAYKLISSGVGSPGGWTVSTVDAANSLQARSMCVGPGSGGSGSRIVIVTNNGNYFYANGASPGSGFTTVSLAGIMADNFRHVVYNRFWNRYLFVPDVVTWNGSTPACCHVSPDNLGSTNPDHYVVNIPSKYTGTNANNATLEDIGAAAAVGPWCYFQTDKGGTGSGILATPDLGRTWWLSTVIGFSSGSNHSYINSLAQYNGRLLATVSDTYEHSVVLATPRVSLANPQGYTP